MAVIIEIMVNANACWSIARTWDFNIIDIPIFVICLKIRSNSWGRPNDQNVFHLP